MVDLDLLCSWGTSGQGSSESSTCVSSSTVLRFSRRRARVVVDVSGIGGGAGTLVVLRARWRSLRLDGREIQLLLIHELKQPFYFPLYFAFFFERCLKQILLLRLSLEWWRLVQQL